MLIIIRNLFALVNAMNFYCIKHDIIVGLSKITTSLILFINKYEHTNHDTYMFYIFNLYIYSCAIKALVYYTLSKTLNLYPYELYTI